MSDASTKYIVSRRTALAGLGAGGLGLALASRVVSAQEATADMATHPIIGVWVSDFNPADPGKVFVFNSYHPDGTYSSLHPFAGTGIGAWRATGERTCDVLLKYLNIASEAGKIEPGIVTVWASITVDDTGDGLTDEAVIELRAPDGTVVALFPSQGAATRMVVEPMPSLPAPEATPTS